VSITAPPLSESCDRDDHGACFPDEPSGCGCQCHPLDDVAGTTQPGTRCVPDPAPGRPPESPRVAPPAGEPGPLSPPWGPGGKKSPQSSRERAVAGTASPVPGKTRSAESSAAVTGDRAEAAGPSLADLRAAAMSEDKGPDSLDAHVRKLAADLGLLRYHTHDARRSPAGFPDLVLCGPGGVLFRELKRQGRDPTPAQQRWLDALAAGGADAGTWRPADLLDGTIAAELVAISGLRGAT
jgi:hypothetical protein